MYWDKDGEWVTAQEITERYQIPRQRALRFRRILEDQGFVRPLPVEYRKRGRFQWAFLVDKVVPILRYRQGVPGRARRNLTEQERDEILKAWSETGDLLEVAKRLDMSIHTVYYSLSNDMQ